MVKPKLIGKLETAILPDLYCSVYQTQKGRRNYICVNKLWDVFQREEWGIPMKVRLAVWYVPGWTPLIADSERDVHKLWEQVPEWLLLCQVQRDQELLTYWNQDKVPCTVELYRNLYWDIWAAVSRKVVAWGKVLTGHVGLSLEYWDIWD